MKRLSAALLLLCASAAPASVSDDPLRFFEGRTEMTGVMNVMMKKPYHVKTIGRGSLGADRALTLIQQVQEEGKSPHERVWRIHQVTPSKYTGTMSDASGPVVIDKIGGRYRFRFQLRGGFSAEQWITPNSDGNSGQSVLTVRKFGLTVASSKSTIRKTSQQALTSP